METRPALRRPATRLAVAVLMADVISGACGTSIPAPTPSVGTPSVAPVEPTATTPAQPSAEQSPTASVAPADRPLATAGSIALVRADGSIWTVDADHRSVMIADASAGTYGFPTWSPDASRIAAVRTGADASAVVVFDTELATAGVLVAPSVIFRAPGVSPFYLSWTPDGQDVSFLASDATGLALRIAPADGSAPIDGSGAGAVIRQGNPFYYDWIDSEHLAAHIGSGAAAFLGEIDRAGEPMGPPTESPGMFRSVVVSPDRRFVGFVRAGTDGADAVVVAARDGSAERTIPVFGLAAVDFSPIDATLATIGGTRPGTTQLGVPAGPLRLIDAVTGVSRELLPGLVASFAWSPDGTTIAAIRVVPVADGSSVSTTSSVSPAATAAPSGVQVRLTFVDVASGDIRSEAVVEPGQTYVSQLMAYFDQYALSHRLWSPDSSSFLLPQTEPDGSTHVDVFFADGGPPVALDGDIGFWSP